MVMNGIEKGDSMDKTYLKTISIAALICLIFLTNIFSTGCTKEGATKDKDKDGLGDNWEREYFDNLEQGPDGDYDDDGYTNLEEYQKGTDPTDPYSPQHNDNGGTYGVSLEIVTKKGGDGNHKPYGYSIHKVDPSVGTQYILLLKNTGSGADSFVLSSDAPSGWNVDFQGENEVKDIPRNEWMYKIVTIRVSSSVSETSRNIALTATSKSDSTIYATVTTKNTVVTHPPGTADLDDHPAKVDYNLVYYGGGKEENQNGWYFNQGSEFEAKDNSVIVGFEEAIKGMMEGQTKVVEVPPEKGYGANDEKHVGGRSLVFEITMLDINSGD